MPFVCIVELHTTPASNKIMSVAKKCFYGQSMSPATINRCYLGLHVKRPTLFPNFNQIWSLYADFHKLPQYKIFLTSAHLHLLNKLHCRNKRNTFRLNDTDQFIIKGRIYTTDELNVRQQPRSASLLYPKLVTEHICAPVSSAETLFL